MRQVIVAVPELEQAPGSRDQDALAAEFAHTAAIAKAVAESGSTPLLIGARDLAKLAPDIPSFVIGRIPTLNALFKIWRWGSSHGNFQILAIGSRSLKLARLIQRLGKRPWLDLYCPILPPAHIPPRYLRYLRYCLSGSSYIKDLLENNFSQTGNQKCSLFAAGPGIDVDAYECADTHLSENRHFVFGMAESLLPASGALLIVRAMAALWQHEDIPDWEVRMFGSGPRFAEVMAEAENLGVLSRLSILGAQPLPEIIKYCHVWLAPGSSPDELPSTLLAGCAAGLPIIARGGELHKQRLPDAATALIIDSDNPQEMAKAMLALMRDSALREKLAAAGAVMRESISLQAMARRVFSILINK